MTSKKAPDVSVVDEMADDAVSQEYPDGAPLLKPYLTLRPRSRRAEFKRKFAGFQESQRKLAAAKDAGLFGDAEGATELSDEQRQAQLVAWADADDMFQLMDDLMAMCAESPDAYQAWSDNVDDDGLSKVFAVFVARSQPGEASSSTS